jgi:UDP-N-acetyl-D-glucosamine dehydrogenase
MNEATTSHGQAQTLSRETIKKVEQRHAVIGVIGLGYVGLPLVVTIANSGFETLGFDIDSSKVAMLESGKSYIGHLPASIITKVFRERKLEVTIDFSRLAEVDYIIICVPTPLNRHREPDLTFVEATCWSISKYLKHGQIVVLESTTYPGTCRDVMKPILETSGLISGRDFFIAYSPEREDPGNPKFATPGIPKVVGGDGEEALRLAAALYDCIVVKTIQVSSLEAAEAVKLTENIFRAVNIALVNELKIVYNAMGIDIWEVIQAAETKPFGYMPFYPGPGLGGHCIPIDPFYLTWKAREYKVPTRFIELAGEINTSMPTYVVEQLARALDRQSRKGLNGSRILIIGIAYKKNVDDPRESPALVLMEMLEQRGADVEFFDPLIPVIPNMREHPTLRGRRSVKFNPESLCEFSAALVVTDHDDIDYGALASAMPMIIDTRNVFMRKGIRSANVVKA